MGTADGERLVRISHPDKVLFPDDGITKGDLAGYYRRVADLLLPHSRGRPLTMHRFPEGIGAGGFFQKGAPSYFPAWIPRVTVDKEGGGTTSYAVCDDVATLLYCVNQNMVVPHVWLSTLLDLRRPDRLVFDLDPGPAGFTVVRDTARLVRDVLDGLGLPAFVKSSGSKGLHVEVPLVPDGDVEVVRAFAHATAEEIVRRDPDRLTVEHRIAKRGGRLFVDVRNGWAQTVVVAYGVRALPGAPVAAPLEWEEVDDPDLDPRRWTVGNLFRRLGQRADPWAAMGDAAVPLDDAMALLRRQR